MTKQISLKCIQAHPIQHQSKSNFQDYFTQSTNYQVNYSFVSALNVQKASKICYFYFSVDYLLNNMLLLRGFDPENRPEP